MSTNSRRTRPVAADPQLSKFEKALCRDARWEKTELQDVVFWFLVIISSILGLVWGCLGFTGYTGFMGYIGASFVVTVYYYSSFLGIDEEEYGGKSALLQEAYTSALGSFIFTWIFAYTVVHHDLLG
ncbi:hypothetical protein IWQ61_008723 [Dispira simplex]|nr:hypothetical protein IWQ61_008723 [Dispira simplex]